MMNYTNYKISWVHLTSRVRQLIVAVLSVTFGISMYIFMNSFMNGVNDAQTEITFTSMSHVKVYNDLPQKSPLFLPHPTMSDTLIMLSNPKRINYTEGIRNVQEVVKILMRDKNVKAVSAQLTENVFFRNGVTKVNGVLYGVDVEDDDRLFNTSQYITEGDVYQLEKRTDGIVLGVGLADKISAKLDDNISLTTSEGVTRIFKVVGLIETGNGSVDKTKAMISILSARQLLSKNRSYATEVLANVADYNKAPEVAQRLQPFTTYKVEPWQEGNSQLESANVLRDILAVVVSLTILIVAGFGIYNIMNMTVNEKMREIAILKAMGFGGNDIVSIFLTQSLVIGLLGGCIGLFLGYVISAIVDRIPFKIASLTDLPIAYIPTDYFMALFFGLIITFVAGYLPAKRASKIDPVDILRG